MNDRRSERVKILRHNIKYADIKIGDWKSALQNSLEKDGQINWHAVDMIEMYAERMGDWRRQLLEL